MTTKRSSLLLGLILSLLLPQAAQCFYNTSTGRWLTRDPVEEGSNPNLYSFTQNCSPAFIDRLGQDLYPANFIGPLLPTDWRATVFQGFEASHFQEHDQQIYELVNDFNANKQWYCGCTAKQEGGVPNTTFDLVKSWFIQEAGGGDSRSRAAWQTDPGQVNVPGDWSPYKTDVGLLQPESRNEGDPMINMMAAVGWLCRKGFGSSGQPASNRPDGFFDNWYDAFQRYNGRNDIRSNRERYSVNYANQIVDRAHYPTVHYPISLP